MKNEDLINCSYLLSWQFGSVKTFVIGGPENGDEAPNSRTIPNETGLSSEIKCYDKRSWCRAADCSIDTIKLLCPKRCKACNAGKVPINIFTIS